LTGADAASKTFSSDDTAEFDTKNPHWFGAAGNGPVEILSMFGKQGERIHLRAKST